MAGGNCEAAELLGLALEVLEGAQAFTLHHAGRRDSDADALIKRIRVYLSPNHCDCAGCRAAEIRRERDEARREAAEAADAIREVLLFIDPERWPRKPGREP